MSELFSLQSEKSFLGGLIKNQEIFPEIEGFLTEKTFFKNIHAVIFNCFKTCYINKERISEFLLAQKIKNLGISFNDDIDIFQYVEAISFTQITPKATIELAQELVKLQALREINHSLTESKDFISKNINEPLSKIISKIDKIYGDKVNSFDVGKDEPEDLFSDLLEQIEYNGNNIKEEVGLITPFDNFNKLYGGLRAANLYVIVARSKAGKTTWLNYLGMEVSRINNVPVLFLDSEMNKKEIQFRLGSSLTNVNPWYLETGNFRKNEEMTKKIRNNLSNLPYKNIQHYHIKDKNIEEVSCIARRWFLKNVGRGKPALIIYDYLKIVDEKFGYNTAEYQLMGSKVNLLKKLSEELQIPIFTAAQSNRSGIVTGKNSKDIIEDEGVVSISDRITWYSTYVGLLRRKTPDEIVLDGGLISGTHFLKELVSRFQGKNASGHMDLILRTMPDGTKKYQKNYINFSIENFKVEEKGTLEDSINRGNAIHLAVDDNKNKNEQTL